MVSVIITTYKRSPEIVKRAAKSVLNQSYKNIELLIIDDSPDTYELRDSVRDMVHSLGESVCYIQHKKNMGACAARNTGLNVAKGEYIAFLDDDDEWLPEKIEKQLSVFKKNKNAAIVYCGRYSYYVKEQKTVVQKTKFKNGYVFDSLILENFIGSTSFPLIRKSVIEKLGGFDINMKAAQDYEMWLRIAKEYEVDYIKEPLVRYYVHEGDQITKNHRNKADALERLNELHIDYLEKHPKILSKRILRISRSYAEFDISKAQRLLIEAVNWYPIPTLELLLLSGCILCKLLKKLK